jgi:membrane protein implicated in regulation of membrane protease activity
MIFTTIQGILASLTSAILVLQLLIGFFIGADSDIDVDGNASGDFDMSTIFSPKGILQFICGSSWYLVLIGKQVLGFTDYAIAGCIGLIFTLIMVGVYWMMYKLQKEIIPERGEKLIGRRGTVYLRKTNNRDAYIIDIEINGRLQALEVISEDSNKTYQTGDLVVIKKYEENIYYI